MITRDLREKKANIISPALKQIARVKVVKSRPFDRGLKKVRILATRLEVE